MKHARPRAAASSTCCSRVSCGAEQLNLRQDAIARHVSPTRKSNGRLASQHELSTASSSGRAPEGSALEEAHGHVVVEQVKPTQVAQAGGDERRKLGVDPQVVLPVEARRPAAQHVQRQGQLPPDRLVGEALVQKLVGLQVGGALRGSRGKKLLGSSAARGALQGAPVGRSRAVRGAGRHWPSAHVPLPTPRI